MHAKFKIFLTHHHIIVARHLHWLFRYSSDFPLNSLAFQFRDLQIFSLTLSQLSYRSYIKREPVGIATTYLNKRHSLAILPNQYKQNADCLTIGTPLLFVRRGFLSLFF